MPWDYTNTLRDGRGNVASGAQVMQNFNDAKAQVDAVDARVGGIETRVTGLEPSEVRVVGVGTAPSYENSWTAAPGTGGTLRFWREGRRVYLSGATRRDAGAALLTIVTLPPDFRPRYECTCVVYTPDGLATVTIRTDGRISPRESQWYVGFGSASFALDN